ncbi:MAG: SufE family protein [OCS116 cluster bacterium]|uniref:Cysteine desulfuration protein SufE n=1 Tax=OCS116 cluster bacterium TaxID=2030921 RepID=A0A2A4ZAL8_9PROT|nr:SufE family protein [OCS116 cluster bacterium]
MDDSFQNISDDFSYLDGWEEKYKYVIELGQQLPALDDVYKVEAYKVKGCTSQVWLKISIDEQNVMTITGDSDAHIVKGLVAILVAYYSGQGVADIQQNDATKLFAHIGLADQLTPQRAGGLSAMIKRIQRAADNH